MCCCCHQIRSQEPCRIWAFLSDAFNSKAFNKIAFLMQQSVSHFRWAQRTKNPNETLGFVLTERRQIPQQQHSDFSQDSCLVLVPPTLPSFRYAVLSVGQDCTAFQSRFPIRWFRVAWSGKAGPAEFCADLQQEKTIELVKQTRLTEMVCFHLANCFSAKMANCIILK